jgi:prepilin signal peptidase PulO-like enzyme (type II secretory pathway)
MEKYLAFIVYLFCGAGVSWVDIKTQKIPKWLIYIPCALSVFADLLFNHNVLADSFYGVLIFWAVFFLTIKIVKNKLGKADVWFAIYCGFISGKGACKALGLCVLLAFLYCTFIALFYKHKRGKIKIPFIPFMYFGTLIVCLFDSVSLLNQ